MKKTIIAAAVVVVLVIAAVLPLIGGRSAIGIAKENIDLVKSEFGGIAAFFGDRQTGSSHGDKKGADPLDADRETTPALASHLHTEVLPSPYNSADKAETVASVGDIDLTDSTGKTADDGEKLGYTAVPLFVERDVGTILPILAAHGLTVNTVTRTNTAPAGEVFAIRYAGFSDDGGFYIDPAIAVTLYVSGAKEAVTSVEKKNTVYLTFDDGPSVDHTEKILDILDRYGICGTFFAIGTSVENHPELARMITERGHNLGCHTMSHVYSEIYASVGALEEEVEKWESVASAAGISLGENKGMFRFPGGSVGNYLDSEKLAEMCGMLERHGYSAFDWNVSANDAVLFLAPEDESSYDYIKQSITDSLEICLKSNEGKDDAPIIVLMHETANETPELLTWIIEYIMEKGLAFGDLADVGGWMF